MQTFILKTHSLQQPANHLHCFYILSKGNNAGKPLDDPCPNCFIVISNSEADKLALYWLCYALWQGGYFKSFLVGSVIEFLHVNVVRQILRDQSRRITADPDKHLKYLNLLQNLLVYEAKLKDQLVKLRELKSSLARGTYFSKR